MTLAVSDSQAGPLGLLIVLLLITVTVFLVRGMNRRLKRLPREFPPPAAPTDDAGPSGSGGGVPGQRAPEPPSQSS